MKYKILLFLAFVIFIGVILLNFSTPINLILIVFAGLLLTIWDYSVFKYKLPADFTMKSQTKRFKRANIILVFLWLISLLTGVNSTIELLTSPIFMVWFMIIVTDLIMIFMYKKEKPTTIFIDKSTLTYNNCWLLKRNLEKLIELDISTFSNELKLKFEKKSEVRIPIKEYKKEDFQQFLNILLDKSQHEITIPKKIFES